MYGISANKRSLSNSTEGEDWKTNPSTYSSNYHAEHIPVWLQIVLGLASYIKYHNRVNDAIYERYVWVLSWYLPQCLCIMCQRPMGEGLIRCTLRIT